MVKTFLPDVTDDDMPYIMAQRHLGTAPRFTSTLNEETITQEAIELLAEGDAVEFLKDVKKYQAQVKAMQETHPYEIDDDENEEEGIG